MPIVSAEYLNPLNTMILVTYDDGRPPQPVPNDPRSRFREEVAIWEATNTITAFEDVAGQVTRGQVLALEKLLKAYRLATVTHQESDGANTFLVTGELAMFITANLNATTPLSLNLADITNTLQAVNVAAQQTLLGNLTVSLQGDESARQVTTAAINAAAAVSDIDTALFNSAFGDLSPAFEFPA